MVKPASLDLPVIQKNYDLVKWYIPILNRLPRDHCFTLGERMINGLYNLLAKTPVGWAKQSVPINALPLIKAIAI
jgi:hypothetical protein